MEKEVEVVHRGAVGDAVLGEGDQIVVTDRDGIVRDDLADGGVVREDDGDGR